MYQGKRPKVMGQTTPESHKSTIESKSVITCKLEPRTTLNAVPQVLSSMALHVVGLADLLGLVISQHLDATGWLPSELDVGLLACLVDHLEGVHTKALHVTPVCGDAPGPQQPHELHTYTQTGEQENPCVMPVSRDALECRTRHVSCTKTEGQLRQNGFILSVTRYLIAMPLRLYTAPTCRE